MTAKSIIEEATIVLKTVSEPIQKRMISNISGPFFIAILFVYWDVVVHIFSKNAQSKIDAINIILQKDFTFIENVQRIYIVAFAWFFWVFLAPFLSPFVRTARKWLINFSKELNNYKTHQAYKNRISKLEDELVISREQNVFVSNKVNEMNSFLIHNRPVLPIEMSEKINSDNKNLNPNKLESDMKWLDSALVSYTFDKDYDEFVNNVRSNYPNVSVLSTLQIISLTEVKYNRLSKIISDANEYMKNVK